jgi:hypothetical protein
VPLSHAIGGLRQAWLGTTADPHTLWWPLLVAAGAVVVAVWTDRRRARGCAYRRILLEPERIGR